MTLWQLAQLYAVAVVFCLFVLGSAIRYFLDDRDRAHLVDAHLAEDAEVQALDVLWDLPTREPLR